MTVNELKAMALDWVEDCSVTDSTLLYMINQIEAKVQKELLRIDPADIVQYGADDGSTALLLGPPDVEVYVTWMICQIYWYMGEYDTYQNEVVMFNNAWRELERSIAEREHAGTTERRPWRN
jgi:hypothetical protein